MKEHILQYLYQQSLLLCIVFWNVWVKIFTYYYTKDYIYGSMWEPFPLDLVLNLQPNWWIISFLNFSLPRLSIGIHWGFFSRFELCINYESMRNAINGWERIHSALQTGLQIRSPKTTSLVTSFWVVCLVFIQECTWKKRKPESQEIMR